MSLETDERFCVKKILRARRTKTNNLGIADPDVADVDIKIDGGAGADYPDHSQAAPWSNRTKSATKKKVSEGPAFRGPGRYRNKEIS